MGVYLRGKSWYYNFYYERKRYNEVEGRKGGDVGKIPMNTRLTEVLSNAKKVNQGEKGLCQ